MLKFLATITLLSISLHALAQKPSQESIESLFEIMDSRQVVEDALSKIDATLQSSLNRSLKGKPATEYQITIVRDAKNEIADLIKNRLNWQQMKPVFIKSYQETFSQEEIDGILAFYQTPAGQALLNKLPVALNSSVALMETRLKDMSPKINQIRDKAINQLKNVTANPSLEVGKGIVSEKRH